MIGCGDGSSDAITPPPAAAAAAPAHDLAAIMEGFAATLRTEKKIFNKAHSKWDEIDDADRQELWSALEERHRLGDEFQAMLLANPDWTETSCAWYASVVMEPEKEVRTLWYKLTAKRIPEATAYGNRYTCLLRDAAGSRKRSCRT